MGGAEREGGGEARRGRAPLADLDAALVAVREGTLAATPGVDLGLDDELGLGVWGARGGECGGASISGPDPRPARPAGGALARRGDALSDLIRWATSDAFSTVSAICPFCTRTPYLAIRSRDWYS